MTAQYFNVYRSSDVHRRGYIYSQPYGSREAADFFAGGRRLYCVKVTLK